MFKHYNASTSSFKMRLILDIYLEKLWKLLSLYMHSFQIYKNNNISFLCFHGVCKSVSKSNIDNEI